MMLVNIHQAKTHLSRILEKVALGEEIILAKAGRPVARIVPYTAPPQPRIPGNDAGRIIISDRFDDPLPEFEP